MKLYQFDRLQYGICVVILIAKDIEQALGMLCAKEGLDVIDYTEKFVRLGEGKIIESYDLMIYDLQEGLNITISYVD